MPEEKRFIVLAVDKTPAEILAERIAGSPLAQTFNVITCYDKASGEADDYQLLKWLDKNSGRLWLLVTDENMQGGESGLTFATAILRNRTNKYAPDAETIMYTGSAKDWVGKAVRTIGGKRAEHFNKEGDGKDVLDKLFAHILERYEIMKAREAPAAPEPAQPTSIQLLEQELAEMTEQERARYWLQQMLSHEAGESHTRGKPISSSIDLGTLGQSASTGGPLRHHVSDELTEIAKRLGANLDRTTALENGAIANRDWRESNKPKIGE